MNHCLHDVCSNAYIVAHRENTDHLWRALQSEGFSVTEVRGPYSDTQLQFSSIYKTFVNHANAWRLVVSSDQYSMIVEADFVPVLGLGSLPLPLPFEHIASTISYLYACGPQFWDVDPSLYFARGHAGAMVAYTLSPRVARLLLQFFDEKCQANPTGVYEPWDAELGYWLKARGVESYLPFRQYGEHGGISNPEHSSAGLGRPHQADVLVNSLHFMPLYAGNRFSRYLAIRMRARIWGWIRLLAGRSLAFHDVYRTEPMDMLRFAVGRLLRLPNYRPLTNTALYL